MVTSPQSVNWAESLLSCKRFVKIILNSLVAQMVKSLPAMQETRLIPGSGRPSGEGNGNPFCYSCLENPMDGGAWRATVYGVAKNWT